MANLSELKGYAFDILTGAPSFNRTGRGAGAGALSTGARPRPALGAGAVEGTSQLP